MCIKRCAKTKLKSLFNAYFEQAQIMKKFKSYQLETPTIEKKNWTQISLRMNIHKNAGIC